MQYHSLDSKRLAPYVKPVSAALIAQLIAQYGISLIIKRARVTKSGDYRHPTHERPYHQITINGNLNQYAFLITFIHEVAHLITWNEFKNRKMPHGSEWKSNYKLLLQPLICSDYFPEDIQMALLQHCKNIKSSSAYDINLMKAITKFNEGQESITTVIDLREGDHFLYNGRLFKRGSLLRTRIKCQCVLDRKNYVFHSLAPIEIIKNEK